MHDLIDSKAISFMSNGPNVNNNPISSHANPLVSMVEAFEGKNVMTSVDKMKTHMATVKEQLLMNGIFPGCDTNCEHYLVNP